VIARAAALAWVLTAAHSAGAHPVTIDDDDDDVALRLDLPDGWKPEEPPSLATGRALAAYAADGRHAVVARLHANTDGAYHAPARYLAGVEDGVQKETPGYRRLERKVRKLGRRPALDLWYAAEDGVHGARFVFFHGLVVLLRVDLPEAHTVDAAARRLVEGFGPIPAPTQ
jgi:hypothetical protein